MIVLAAVFNVNQLFFRSSLQRGNKIVSTIIIAGLLVSPFVLPLQITTEDMKGVEEELPL